MKIIFAILFVMLFLVAGAIETNSISNLAGVIMLASGIAGMAVRLKMMEMKGR